MPVRWLLTIFANVLRRVGTIILKNNIQRNCIWFTTLVKVKLFFKITSINCDLGPYLSVRIKYESLKFFK